MGREGVDHRGVVVAVVGALALAATYSLALAPAARAASPLEILVLRLQPCPEYEVGRRRDDYTEGELAAAKQGDIDVMQGRPAHLEPPVDWAQDPYANRSWVHYLHGFLWLDQLLASYVSTNDLAALADARDLMLDWVHEVRPGDPTYPVDAWGDKTTGDRAGYLAYVTRAAACRGLLSDAQASELIDATREHGATLASSDGYVANNHGLFVDIGLARIALQMAFLPEADAWAGLARSRFHSTLHGRLIEDEGLWLEHSATYHFLTMRLVTRFAQVTGLQAAFADELELMTGAAGWLIQPSGRWIPWGDSNAELGPQWAIEEADEWGLRVFDDSGLAVVRDGGGYLAVTAAFHNVTHKHPDELGFQLFDRGREVVSDTGFPGYNLDKWRRLSRSVQGHSVLTVGDWEFPVGEPDRAYGSGIVAAGGGDGWYAIEAHNPLLRLRGVRHRRLFLYRPGRALLVLDRVRSRRRRTYTRLFQVAPGLRASGRGARVRLKGSGFNGALRDEGRRSRRSKVKGYYSPPRGWSFPAGQARVPRWAIRYQSRAASARYLTAIGLRGTATARIVARRKRSIAIEVGGPALRTSTLRVARAGDRLRVKRTRGRHPSR